MALERVKAHSLVDHIVTEIEHVIVNGDFAPGDRLPPMPEMQETLGASRGTLREALRILEQKGLVEVRVGKGGGVFVRESSTTPLTEGLALLIRQKRISVDHLAGFRTVLESGLIELVCQNITARELRELNAFLADMEVCAGRGPGAWHDFLDVEVDLRKALIRIARNPMYEAVLVPIHENIFAYGHDIPGEAANVMEAFEDWKAILAAVESGDAERASFMTRDHIGRYAKKIKENKARSALAGLAPSVRAVSKVRDNGGAG